MKKVVWFFVFVSLFMGLNGEWYSFNTKTKGTEGLSLMNSKSLETQIHLSLSGMDIQNAEKNFVELQIKDGRIYKENEGSPAIPYYRKAIAIPDRGQPIITIENIKTITLQDKFNIVPAQGPLPEIRNYKPEWQYNETVYNTDAFYPNKIAEIEHIEIMRSFRIAYIDIYPVQYNPKTGEVKVITNCDIKITYEGKGEKEMTQTIPITPRWEGIYKLMIWNYDQVKDTKPYYDNIHASINKDANKASKALNSYGYFDEGDYIVFIPGTSGDMSGSMNEFLSWKLKLGYMPEVHWVDPAIDPSDLRDIIQTFYSDADANHTDPTITPEFILIVGEGEENEVSFSIEAEPHDFSSIYSYGVESGIVRNDHYFSLMDDTVDYHSDLFVSRFSVDDTTELKLWIDKTMRYEGNPPTGDWYASAFAIGDTEDTRIFNRTARSFMLNLVNNGNYTEIDTMLEENYANGAMVGPVQDSLDDGHNIMVFRGHGDEGTGFAWYGGANNGYDEWIDNNYIAGMGATSLGVGFVFAPTCLANNFTYPNIDAMGEYFVNTGLTTGAVGYFGATNVSLSFYNDSMALGISHALTGATATTEFQVVSVYGKDYMDTYAGSVTYFKLEDYLMNEVGDPAARIWTKEPIPLTATYDPTYYTGTDTILVTVTDPTKAPVANAVVVLWDTTGTDALYARDVTNSSGQAQFVVTLNDTGTAELMISASKQDYIPYIGTADVAPGLSLASISLNAYEENGSVNLNWNITGSIEDNIDIYRNNEFIASVSPYENSYIDNAPIDGENTYILKVNDKEYAKTIVNVKTYNFDIYGITPYILHNNAVLSFSMPNKDNVVMSIYDVSGKKVYEENILANKGLNKFTINANTINNSNGLYFVKLSYNGNNKIAKFIIAK